MRVHDEILKRQQLPPPLVSKGIWDERLADIAHFEDYPHPTGDDRPQILPEKRVARHGTEKALYAAAERPEKNWKFSASDVHERKFWDDYMHAFEKSHPRHRV